MSRDRMSRTKIVATVGPACHSLTMLTKLVRAGVDVFRINTAHGSRQEHQSMVDLVRQVEQATGRSIGILVDLAGPKIRLGQLYEEPTICGVGCEFRFVRGQTASAPDELVSIYDRLIDELSVGDCVMLADGTVTLEVVSNSADEARCVVRSPGQIRNRQGINLPGVKLSAPTLSEEDEANAYWAAENELDFLGISFVRSAEDLRDLSEKLVERFEDPPWLIAKIEKPEALEHLEAIVAAADAAMIARGDLGVETDVADLAVVQKRIIATCNRMGKPVIVATQMLDSMQQSTQPTRAEATDVANAILDGTDACMLSGETAVGRYPLESVKMMRRIITATEPLYRPPPGGGDTDRRSLSDAVLEGTGRIASALHAKMVVIATRSGTTAVAKSKQRDRIPTIAVADQLSVLRRMSLVWGITPLQNAPVDDPVELWSFVDRWGRSQGLLDPGDYVVLVAGRGFDSDAHNSVVVHEVTS